MAVFQLQIISHEGDIWTGEAEAVKAIGVEGSFGVLANHAPMIAALVPGAVTVRGTEGTKFYAIGEGILEVRTDKRVIMLVDYAEPFATAEEATVKAKELQHML